MDHQAKPGETLADNPPKIWLAPRCNIDERTWCEDDTGCCDECGEPTVEYVRADLQTAEIARLRADLEAERASQCSAVDGMLTAEKEADRLRAELTQTKEALAEITRLRVELTQNKEALEACNSLLNIDQAGRMQIEEKIAEFIVDQHGEWDDAGEALLREAAAEIARLRADLEAERAS